ncbi:cytochrome d ubiquinol oxidase subunit II [Ammonifex thiophilus]|uniref:Cytochrome d ubiquinol oxidase subunit II n=1 Tax=Ammonifex thiophilus TaxID=444093 RepID=A0A3D8P8K3_9THEO|nr:cytochrome d ubiquinol oxidase subunit II [Ammonifex thiophilus]RDV84885.1 cytochrome d ubiquinol oxidase subunit II [Ammonifex thiophilus]
MELNVLWFILIAVLFAGYFFLEGFDYGVGVLVPFLGRTDTERRILLNTFGPFWDGNEVWLITAGGALFAAFPHWYATLFSGFYLALFLILVALILRAVALEFRHLDESPGWRRFWDGALCFGSFLPSLLWGVAFANLLKGVPINAEKQFVGTFFDLLSPYTLVGGLALLFLFLMHGALFVALRTEGELEDRAKKYASPLAVLAMGWVGLFLLLSLRVVAGKPLALALFLLVLALLGGSYGASRANRSGWAFALGGLSIVFLTFGFFSALFPRVMVSSLNPDWSLTVYNASSSPYTLKVMTVVALLLVPVVLLYQGWTYWIFRKRVTIKDLHY